LAPHMGYSEERVIEAWYKESADNLAEWLDGKMPDAVIV
jgi:lactate dehydrogenase-like 2-hydroxyacid dehydrogenase